MERLYGHRTIVRLWKAVVRVAHVAATPCHVWDDNKAGR